MDEYIAEIMKKYVIILFSFDTDTGFFFCRFKKENKGYEFKFGLVANPTQK